MSKRPAAKASAPARKPAVAAAAPAAASPKKVVGVLAHRHEQLHALDATNGGVSQATRANEGSAWALMGQKLLAEADPKKRTTDVGAGERVDAAHCFARALEL